MLSTERVIISIDEVRTLVASSQFSPSVGRYRVMVIEDADRMTERTSQRAAEGARGAAASAPCGSSARRARPTCIPTIRSRVRTVRLRVPSVDDVAALHRAPRRRRRRDRRACRPRGAEPHRHGAPPGHERRGARRRRDETLELGARHPHRSPTRCWPRRRLLEIAGDDAKAITEERDAEEREHALRSLGVEPGGTVPPALRGAAQGSSKTTRSAGRPAACATASTASSSTCSRSTATSCCCSSAATSELVNQAVACRLDEARSASHESGRLRSRRWTRSPSRATASTANVAPALALEAMLVAVSRHAVR